VFTNTAGIVLPSTHLWFFATSSDTAMPSPLRREKSPLIRPRLNTDVMLSGSTAVTCFTPPAILA
jgi:hypothetical protein